MDALRGLARRGQVTLFTTLLSGFTLLLARYGRQEDLLVGMPVANRDRADFDNIVGLFVNTLVLRADLSGRPSTSQLLASMRDVCLDAVAHGDMPLDHLVEAMQPQRDMSRNPLFQVMFAQQSAPQGALKLEGITVRPLIVHAGGALFDLTLQVEETAGGLNAVFEYATDLFDEPTIARLANHWRQLLAAMLASPERNVWELPMLAEAERQQLLVEWNDTAVVYPGHDQCLHQLIEAQAVRTPEQVALVCEDQQLTYAELNQRADQVAHHLQRRGVGPDVLVGLFAERSLEMVVGLLGILKAGGAYVPMDPEYPADRIAFMLEDAGINILLTQAHTKSHLPPNPAQTICLDHEGKTIARHDGTVVRDQTTPRNLAYMIYTSGSTGRPKGALNTHQGVCNRLLWMQDRYQLTPADSVLQKTPCSFDVSVWEFFWPLLAGARLVLARPGGHRDPAYLARLIREEEITVMHFVPSMLRAFLTEPTVANCTTLRHVICSGEALPHDLQEQFFARMSCELHNLYGPTEAAVDVTHWTCQRHSEARIVPIGRPVANTQIYILDDALNPVPIGAAGELYIGGVQVGRGYHNRPELTAQKFVGDPFSNDPDARLYRTGDLARWLPDGNIDYLGRIDSQVKVRGFRIELGEIEQVLVADGRVKEAVVVASDDPDGDKRLVAYYVARPDRRVDAGELGNALKEKLPEYMVPSYFVELESFPLTPNGKLDRKALPAPSREHLPSLHEFVRPHTETEIALAVIWSEVLKVERVGCKDNFFDLGGYSLLAIKTLARIRDVFAVDLPMRTLFEKPVLSDLAGAVDALQWLRLSNAPADGDANFQEEVVL
jgi:amino acid adenylation domain-containing protein